MFASRVPERIEVRYSLAIAYLLWLFGGVGVLGLQRYYLGKIGTGVLWTVTGGLGGFGAFYDFFTLPRQVREANIRDAARLIAESRLAESYGRSAPARAAPREPLERAALKVARASGGHVTPGELSLESDCTLDEARKVLDELARKGYAEVKVRSSGVVVYGFPEFYREGRNDFEIG